MQDSELLNIGDRVSSGEGGQKHRERVVAQVAVNEGLGLRGCTGRSSSAI